MWPRVLHLHHLPLSCSVRSSGQVPSVVTLLSHEKNTVERLKPKQTSWSHRKLLRLDLHTHASLQIFCPPFSSPQWTGWTGLVQEFSLWLAGVNQCVVCYWCRRFCHQVTPQVSSRCAFNNDINEWQNSSWLVHCGWYGSWIHMVHLTWITHKWSSLEPSAYSWSLMRFLLLKNRSTSAAALAPFQLVWMSHRDEGQKLESPVFSFFPTCTYCLTSCTMCKGDPVKCQIKSLCEVTRNKQL